MTFKHLGPFLPEPITFEKDVTVITGPNDCGKSVLLRLIALGMAKDGTKPLSVEDVNLDHTARCKTHWEQDREIGVTITFNTTMSNGEDTATADLLLAPQFRPRSQWRRPGYQGTLSDQERQSFPTVIYVEPAGKGVRETVPLDAPNELERRLLRVAFGPEFSASALVGLPDRVYHATIANAEKRLNARLNKILPPTLSYSFRFNTYADKRDQLCVNIDDVQGGTTGLAARGTGIQALVNLIGSLATENFAGSNFVILLDEPELHLHADAQHSLRRTLEELGAASNVQVIYATHSPCMVNPMRPQSLRVLERVQKGDKAYSRVLKSPYDEGFAKVRSSLGISLADSLLLAPATVIVEGKTEILCIPFLINRLAGEGKLPRDLVERVFTQTIFLEAVGVPNIPNLVRISRAQGSTVFAFIDGHDADRWKTQIAKCNGDVPLFVCMKDGEFEDIVSRETYFQALADHYKELGKRITLEDFRNWEIAADPTIQRLSFTNKVQRWFQDKLALNCSEKPAIMLRALELANTDDVDASAVIQLSNAIYAKLEKS